jgi:phenylacetate-coenzyme A ligase PaaK-like adenylate-forming protein
MNGLKSFKERLKILNDNSINGYLLELFNFQVNNNPVYREYVKAIGINARSIVKSEDVPFLPISLFKYRKIKTTSWNEELIFESSGTAGMDTSKHYIQDEGFYKDISTTIFQQFYGNPKDYVILALLPSYLERKNSSLIYMVRNLIKLSKSEYSEFYLSNFEELRERILYLKQNSDRKIILWGVTFALLDFAQGFPMDMRDSIILETGGMKGRGEEVIREEVHKILKKSFQVEAIHSEYGMTELLSQAYSIKDGLYKCPPWMRVFTREINDPFCINQDGRQGVINIIDLANIHSCAFIATEDLGRVHPDGTFEVLGRLDNSDMRGCNFLLN